MFTGKIYWKGAFLCLVKIDRFGVLDFSGEALRHVEYTNLYIVKKATIVNNLLFTSSADASHALANNAILY
jgi:hypothetical protein